MNILNFFLKYRPPTKLRALFIIHYAPLLFIILIGPITPIYGVWKLPVDVFFSIFFGIVLFFIGAFIYLKWEMFWFKTYKGQLVTSGIFRRIRHPHYTSLIIICFGLAFFFNSLLAIYSAFISVPIMIISIIDEEKLLIKQYGVQYEMYMEKVPWRIIPGFF
jgi:protein-S-isoprenylcysteine O-methyltransferase Ste14